MSFRLSRWDKDKKKQLNAVSVAFKVRLRRIQRVYGLLHVCLGEALDATEHQGNEGLECLIQQLR